VPFVPEEDRDARFRAADCNQRLRTMKEQIGVRICGMCVKVCSHGRGGSG